ncbi:unnamed protein product, partial [Vitis vinifera]|uniref:Uncharacterized protein n=1 Tax=Vitis vinifera TaxID=29760 RepID=D7SJZ8_VITVI
MSRNAQHLEDPPSIIALLLISPTSFTFLTMLSCFITHLIAPSIFSAITTSSPRCLWSSLISTANPNSFTNPKTFSCFLHTWTRLSSVHCSICSLRWSSTHSGIRTLL